MAHVALWGLSWLARAGLLKHPERLARPLLTVKRALSAFGSDRGGMSVTVHGRGHDQKNHEKRWVLDARDGDGPYVPALASVVLTKALVSNDLQKRGAMPCFNLFSYEAFQHETEDLAITCTFDQRVC